ncbi:hypothetical protein M3J07_007768 [Ascochyta lentis]
MDQECDVGKRRGETTFDVLASRELDAFPLWQVASLLQNPGFTVIDQKFSSMPIALSG